MNNAIQPVQGLNAQSETQQTALPKNQQATTQKAPQDEVTISQQAQALASKNNTGA